MMRNIIRESKMKAVTQEDVFRAAMLYVERVDEHKKAKNAYRKNLDIYGYYKCTCKIENSDLSGYDHAIHYHNSLPKDQICDNCNVRIAATEIYWKSSMMMGGAKRSLFSKAQNFKKQNP